MQGFLKGRVYGSAFSSMIINILYVSFSVKNFNILPWLENSGRPKFLTLANETCGECPPENHWRNLQVTLNL
jgi:hypothetical protein